MTKVRYFTLITMMSDQKIRDRIPRTFGALIARSCSPRKHSRSAYSGEVPMSP